MKIRKPVAAGTFYPSDKNELTKLLKRLLANEKALPGVIGAYLPHAGYIYSGSVAGATLSLMPVKSTYIVLGPNHSGMGMPFSIMPEGKWQTPLGEMEIDNRLAELILGNSRYLKNDYLAHVEEHSVEVQLPFIQYLNPAAKIVPVVLRDAPLETYIEIGEAIARAVRISAGDIGVIASGDMTHYEPAKTAKIKDNHAIAAMIKLDAEGLIDNVRTLSISMCGFAPAAVMMTAVKRLGATRGQLVAYQTSGDKTGDQSSVVGYAGLIFLNGEESWPVKIARRTVESYVLHRKTPEMEDITFEMQKRAGVFVSLHKDGELRGCIGTIEPQQKNIAREIMQNAISSAIRDPRFNPVTPDELDAIEYSVDILTEPEPVPDETQLDPKKYGVIVVSGNRRGLLLPDLEGVDTVHEQIAICRRKAGIAFEEPVKLYRFEVKRYK